MTGSSCLRADTGALVAAIVRVLEDRELAVRLGAAARDVVRLLAPDGRRLRGLLPVARRPGARRRALMKLVFVTQTLDPEHAALAQTLELVVRSRPASTSSWSSRATRRLGRAPEGSPCARSTPVRRSDAVWPSNGLAADARRCRRCLRAHGPRVRSARGSGCEGATCPASPLVHALARRARAESGDARLRTPRSASTRRASRRHAEAAARSAMRSTSTASTAGPPAAHAGPLRLLALGRTARWKGLATLLDATAPARRGRRISALEIRGPSLTPDEEAHRGELERRDRRRRRGCAGASSSRDSVSRSGVPGAASRAADRGRQPERAAVGRDASTRPCSRPPRARGRSCPTNAAFAPLPERAPASPARAAARPGRPRGRRSWRRPGRSRRAGGSREPSCAAVWSRATRSTTGRTR